jgi:hypothetical protein
MGAFQDTMSQATWAMMQEWMNKKSRAFTRQQMEEAAKIASAQLQEGGALDSKKTLEQLAANMKGNAFAKLLGITDQDDPSAIRAMEIIKAMMPSVVPDALTALVPGMRESSDIAASGLKGILTSNDVQGADISTMARSMGGMDKLQRLLELGASQQANRDELPIRRIAAMAGLQRAAGGSGGGGMSIDERQERARFAGVITKTKAEIQKIAAKFTGTGSGSNFEAMVQAVIGMMPESELRGMPAADQKTYATQWVKDVGPEFFGRLNKQVQEIDVRFNSGQQLSENEIQLLIDSADIYGTAEKFRYQKEQVITALQQKSDADWPAKAAAKGLPVGTPNPANVRNLLNTNPQFKDQVYLDTWNMLYGGK